jgi:hypothetical protein
MIKEMILRVDDKKEKPKENKTVEPITNETMVRISNITDDYVITIEFNNKMSFPEDLKNDSKTYF